MDGIVVIKCGGSTVEELSADFFQSIAAMKDMGKHPIIVHGGGPAINDMLVTMQIKPEFVDGLRKTTAEVLETAELVLSGKVNKKIVTAFQDTSKTAIGLSGVDGDLIKASPLNLDTLGYVGNVEDVNQTLLLHIVKTGSIPVIAPIASDINGGKLNVNADVAAAAVAQAMQAEELMFVTDVDGVMIDGNMQETLTVSDIDKLVNDGTIYGGMIPKVRAAADSLTDKLEKVTIANGNGKNRHENGTLKGTTIIKEKRAVH
ncbi:N-acetylglutamate kinase [Alteribacillus persepolensis]|uniref:Acetylglutamate kinase n=2 Tax=Alteribacillus persepolensis TaxID=568899 RepID=A0A1G8H338_9BACI|nr:N-acetylglutamate kinase [Alteribacillus persepolensis]